MRRKRRLRTLFWWSLGGFTLFVLLCNRWIINSTDAYLYTNFALLPENEVGIVLGTSSYTREGEPNPQFYARVQAAAQLYEIGKIKRIIVSGSTDANYNEPRRMQEELAKAGVPAKDIQLDLAGDRTLDSLARASHVSGLQRCTIITQRYHAYRAVFIGKKLGMRVAAYIAPIAPGGELGKRNPPREVFARVMAVLDLFVLKTQSKFLGHRGPISVEPMVPATEAPVSAPPPVQEAA